MFDHTVGKYFWFKNLIISFIELLRLKKKFFYYSKKYLKLKSFLPFSLSAARSIIAILQFFSDKNLVNIDPAGLLSTTI